MSRPEGTGTITTTTDGRHWARLPRRHQRRSVGVYDTAEEAEAVLTSTLKRLDGGPVASMRFGAYGETVLDARAKTGMHRGYARDLTRWKATVGKSVLGKLSVVGEDDLNERDVRRWLAGLRKRDGSIPNATTQTNALSLVRAVLDAAILAGHRTTNPARAVRIDKSVRRNSGTDLSKWTWLRLPEIDRVLTDEKVPLASRLFWQFAIYTGLRPTEQAALTWDAIDLDRMEVHVRASRDVRTPNGKVNRTTKNGKSRTIALLRPAAEALRAWAALSKTAGVRSSRGVIWPAPDGSTHADGYDAGWSEHVESFGFGRRVRYYDATRHTHASHLVQGSWAPDLVTGAFSLAEVRDVLGHSTVKVTERYAHLCADGIRSKVVRPEPPPKPEVTPAIVNALAAEPIDEAIAFRASDLASAAGPGYGEGYDQQPHRGIEPRTYGLRNRCSTSELVWRGPAS